MMHPITMKMLAEPGIWPACRKVACTPLAIRVLSPKERVTNRSAIPLACSEAQTLQGETSRPVVFSKSWIVPVKVFLFGDCLRSDTGIGWCHGSQSLRILGSERVCRQEIPVGILLEKPTKILPKMQVQIFHETQRRQTSM